MAERDRSGDRRRAARGSADRRHLFGAQAAYRTILSAGHDDVAFIYLKGDKDLIAERLGVRSGHFMPPSSSTANSPRLRSHVR